MKIATPISHLFKEHDTAKKIIALSDCLECRDDAIDSMLSNQEVFHCELQPIHEFGIEQYKYIEKIARKKTDLKLISFHSAACCSHAIVEGNVYKTGGEIYSKKQMIENAKKNFTEIKSIFNNKIKIAVENNNYFSTPAYNHVTEPEFLKRVVIENDIEFLLDIAHAEITAINKDIDFDEYLNRLPLNKLIQVHLCRYGFTQKKMAYDAHDLPDQDEWNTLEKLALKYPSLKYMTIEYYKDKEKLLAVLSEARKLINGLS